MEKVRIKLVKNEGSTNVVSNEESYYAKGINSRKLEGENYEYAYLNQEDLEVLSKLVAKKLRSTRRKKYNKESSNAK